MSLLHQREDIILNFPKRLARQLSKYRNNFIAILLNEMLLRSFILRNRSRLTDRNFCVTTLTLPLLNIIRVSVNFKRISFETNTSLSLTKL